MSVDRIAALPRWRRMKRRQWMAANPDLAHALLTFAAQGLTFDQLRGHYELMRTEYAERQASLSRADGN